LAKLLHKAKNVGSRITGFSIPFFGLSWQPPVSERELLRGFIAFLEDRRALYVPSQLEIEGDVRWSVEFIRTKCTELLATLSESSEASPHIRAIRAACRKYMSKETVEYPNLRHSGDAVSQNAGWLIGLGELRSSIGIQLSALTAAYGIELEEDLASILPQEADEE
jgi:hypothetical protein